MSASSNRAENYDTTQPILLNTRLRNIETVLAEEDESCESEHFVACDDLSITNDGFTNANDHQKIDFATGTYTNCLHFCPTKMYSIK